MNFDTNALNWFEIPVKDMVRAKHFYQVSFGIHMHEETMMDIQMAYFPYNPESGKVGGALAKSDFHVPSENGVIIYLNGNPDLAEILERVESEHGRVIMPKTFINEQIGYMAFFIDTEGNRIGIHSQH